MNWALLNELLRLDEELETVRILREHISEGRLYLVDRRLRLVAVVRRVQVDECDFSKLLGDEDK